MSDASWRRPLTGLTARDVVHARAATVPAASTVGELRAYFTEHPSHRVAVLVDDVRFAGAVSQDALPAEADAAAPAVGFAAEVATIAADAPAADARDLGVAAAERRVVVVEPDGRYVGVVAINHRCDDFCGVA